MTGTIGRLGLLGALALTVILPQTASATGAAPANDNFANATQMAFLPFEDSYVDLTNATVEAANETGSGCGTPGATVWYRLQPSQNYTVKLRAIANSNLDLMIAVYEGSSLNALNGWGCVDNGGYGNYTCIDHGGGISTCYAHQSSFATSNGASVSQGQVIGYVGCTGHCFGDHLHFETRVNGSPVDPMGYL